MAGTLLRWFNPVRDKLAKLMLFYLLRHPADAILKITENSAHRQLIWHLAEADARIFKEPSRLVRKFSRPKIKMLEMIPAIKK